MARLRVRLPKNAWLDSALSVEVIREARDPQRQLSLVGVARWGRKERRFFRATVELSPCKEAGSQRIRFPLEENLPAPLETTILSVHYWLISEVRGKESERFAIPLVPREENDALPLQMFAQRGPDEPSVELALRSSRVATCIEGALSVQAPLAEPVVVELHEALRWRPGTLAETPQDRTIEVSLLPTEALDVGATCFFVITLPKDAHYSWSHPEFAVRWFLRIKTNFGTSRWSFDVDIERRAGQTDPKRSTKAIPLVGTRRRRRELEELAGDELSLEEGALIATFGATTIAMEYDSAFSVRLAFADIGVDLGDASDAHARRCLGLLLAGNDRFCTSASGAQIGLNFQPSDRQVLRQLVDSMVELGRMFDASIAHLPVLPRLQNALPSWQLLAERLDASLSPAGLVLRAIVQRQKVTISPHADGLAFAVECAIEASDPRLMRFEQRMTNRFGRSQLVHQPGRLTLLVEDVFASEDGRLTPEIAALSAREFAAFAAEFVRAGVYR